MQGKRPVAIDLFAGCGGVTVGLRQAGFRVAAALEIESLASRTYRMNHRGVRLTMADIRDVDGRKWLRELGLRRGQLGLLAGCPPCQGFSTLRTRNGATWNRDPRNNLVAEMLRLVKEMRPKTVMMENVPRLAEKKVFRDFTDTLECLGYKVKWDIVDVKDYAVPQRRRRLVLVAGRGIDVRFPKPVKSHRTVREAIGHLPPAGKSGDPLHDLPEQRSEAVRRKIAKIPRNGGSRRDLPKHMQLECHLRCNGFKDIYGRMAWDEVSPTITGGCFNPSKGRFLHPARNRNITMREAALLQTFPSRYKFDLAAGKQGVALMIGNALPPELVRRQAVEVKRALACAQRVTRRNGGGRKPKQGP
ncbi:MAG: DNA cytosine methyltransferase [Verrucomicrobia bacterium]|jgi:DNA (cytosine-5)-methyltransferase 1|nr:DNA cytosine methyltransferase [Verrucomicrobiota bacterium]